MQTQRAVWDFTKKNNWNNATEPQPVSITGEILLLPGRTLIGVRWEGERRKRERKKKQGRDKRKEKCVGGVSGGHLGSSPEGKIDGGSERGEIQERGGGNDKKERSWGWWEESRKTRQLRRPKSPKSAQLNNNTALNKSRVVQVDVICVCINSYLS